MKRSIVFGGLLEEEIKAFAEENKLNFSEAVRILIQNALGFIPDEWIKKRSCKNG